MIVCQIHRRIPQSRVASLFSIIQHERRSASAFQLFIVGSKQFFRSFYPFLLYLTFSILKIEILSARVGTNKYQACKLLIRYLLEVNRQSARSFQRLQTISSSISSLILLSSTSAGLLLSKTRNPSVSSLYKFYTSCLLFSSYVYLILL